jgi:hypothetical protein
MDFATDAELEAALERFFADTPAAASETATRDTDTPSHAEAPAALDHELRRLIANVLDRFRGTAPEAATAEAAMAAEQPSVRAARARAA